MELSQCCSHQGYYTALSRSSTAARTLILMSFHFGKITSGASGALRQEFKELELLDDITRLKFKDKLPRRIAMADCRNILIDLFHEYRGKNHIPSAAHVTIQWNKADPFLEWQQDAEVHWWLVSSCSNKASKKPPVVLPDSTPITPQIAIPITPQNTTPTTLHLKHKRSYKNPVSAMPKLKVPRLLFYHVMVTDYPQASKPNINIQTNVPVGTQWHNNSCAYDAVITILFNIWCDDPDAISEDWGEFHCNMLDSLTQEFERHNSMQILSSAIVEQVTL